MNSWQLLGAGVLMLLWLGVFWGLVAEIRKTKRRLARITLDPAQQKRAVKLMLTHEMYSFLHCAKRIHTRQQHIVAFDDLRKFVGAKGIHENRVVAVATALASRGMIQYMPDTHDQFYITTSGFTVLRALNNLDKHEIIAAPE